MHYCHVATPIGPLLLAADDQGLRRLVFAVDGTPAQPLDGWRRDRSALADATGQIEAWFAGELQRFALALAPRGTTFQLSVWALLADIPWGRTTTYGALAEQLGEPGSARAVGAANGANPLPIIVPCHRVIGADGSLTGFSGGLAAKRWLLAHEGQSFPYQAALFGDG